MLQAHNANCHSSRSVVYAVLHKCEAHTGAHIMAIVANPITVPSSTSEKSNEMVCLTASAMGGRSRRTESVRTLVPPQLCFRIFKARRGSTATRNNRRGEIQSNNSDRRQVRKRRCSRGAGFSPVCVLGRAIQNPCLTSA